MNTQRVQSLLGRLELLWFGITRVWRLFFSIPSEKNSFLECFLHLYFLQDILFYSLCALCFYGWFYTLCLIVWCKALCNCLNTFHCFCLFLAQVKGSHKVPETISMYSLVMWANTSHRKAGGVKKKKTECVELTNGVFQLISDKEVIFALVFACYLLFWSGSRISQKLLKQFYQTWMEDGFLAQNRPN